ncbi:class I SAM-dependent methyltransferase [Candidatus Sumerlaeota bacterium]|nr:class I SAM-dependent methyltransferase [Candidatus Sumerlaeota bacterium]
MGNKKNKAFDNWTKAYRETIGSPKDLNWPPTPLIRMFKGNYIPGIKKDYKGKKVLDIGCGTGNNMIFFKSLGLKLYGTEVTDEICRITRDKMSPFGINPDIRTGTNRNIPFDDDYFDYLVSWNVIHYENNEEDMKQAIREYARVLKKGGRLFLSTTGPKHMIKENAQIVGPHLYKIGRKDDFRKGEVFFYFDTPEYIKYYFSDQFRDIYIGTVSDFMFTEWQDYFLVTAVK